MRVDDDGGAARRCGRLTIDGGGSRARCVCPFGQSSGPDPHNERAAPVSEGSHSFPVDHLGVSRIRLLDCRLAMRIQLQREQWLENTKLRVHRIHQTGESQHITHPRHRKHKTSYTEGRHSLVRPNLSIHSDNRIAQHHVASRVLCHRNDFSCEETSLIYELYSKRRQHTCVIVRRSTLPTTQHLNIATIEERVSSYR